MAASECHCVFLTASPSPVISRAAYSYTQVWLEAKNHHFLVSHQLLVHLIIVVCTTKVAFWKFQKCLLFGFNENQPELKDVKYALILFYFFLWERLQVQSTKARRQGDEWDQDTWCEIQKKIIKNKQIEIHLKAWKLMGKAGTMIVRGRHSRWHQGTGVFHIKQGWCTYALLGLTAAKTRPAQIQTKHNLSTEKGKLAWNSSITKKLFVTDTCLEMENQFSSVESH